MMFFSKLWSSGIFHSAFKEYGIALSSCPVVVSSGSELVNNIDVDRT